MSSNKTINEREFREMCDYVFEHRAEIWVDRDIKTPGLDDASALLQYLDQEIWVKVGRGPRALIGDPLITPIFALYDGIQAKADKYGNPPFDSRPIIDEMLRKV